MPIVGLGLDVVELDRIQRIWERFGETFARRVLTEAEQARLHVGSPVPYLASRFAAKEAAVKALGTGFRHGITFQQIEISSRSSGQPELRFFGAAQDVAARLGAHRVHLSLTHGRDTAAAVVILEHDP
ncbi:holo-[acyl-carrier-protein] synthase [Desulfonatronum thiodismutans]|uniref:holo-[acyl-carrier-protein] synthase n=1 Tax=Desulfonatronum thiodismutans TaxID=159290 RepID=UPI0004ABD82F|nr:holo-[acyl-carrier-protein] synthase [Desulfonatronum thiodismutans]